MTGTAPSADSAPPYAFVAAPLDRAEHLRSRPEALARLWRDARCIVVDAEGQALTDARGEAWAPASGERPALDAADPVFLGVDAAARGWFALAAEVLPVGADAPRIDLRTAAAQWPALEATAFAQARAVLHWRRRHRHCGACGAPLRYARAGWLGQCPACGVEHYPRTDPAVIVAVSDGERLLLGRQAGWPPRRWSVLAGFVEPGETLEQTIAREVWEESGVRVRHARYLGSQPWPFPSSLMLGFEALAEPDPPQVNDDELEDARWFDRDEIGHALAGTGGDDGILLSPRISISRWLIAHWYRHGAFSP
ncbi:NAD(+) diphosphatase [Luteimonas huabeiensis]|uniref:NAD(+) diphosphatase n=1 Tax=Luteimonas huabeiensis TaxID=1244513 RepID=UPI0004655997|nr:NAD(+) diphosphatase [Luteimonas huabeiensis]